LNHPKRRGPKMSAAHPSIAAVLAWEKSVSGSMNISTENFHWKYKDDHRCVVQRKNLRWKHEGAT